MRVRFASRSLLEFRTGTVIAVALVILAGIATWETVGHRKQSDSEVCQPTLVTPSGAVTDAYDRQVLSLDPVLYLTMGSPSSATQPDLSGNDRTATYMPTGDPPGATKLPNGDVAAQFNGQDQYAEVPSSEALSVTDTGCLTVEAWIRPATLQFPKETGTGYVNVLGKGNTDKQEWVLRMYSEHNSESPERPNRISAYAYNLDGGLGSGSYFQDKVIVNEWIMVAFVINDHDSSAWPDGYISIYKNGDLRDQSSLGAYDVKPQAADAPFCIGTRELDSFFEGAIGKVAVYDSALSNSEIAATYDAMLPN
jgi:concanavalin A-like lectin/glucanase superfamily protein